MKPRTLDQKKKARKAYLKNKRIQSNNPNKGEWIAMRLLFLLLAGDVSNGSIDDVKRTIEYFKNRFHDKSTFDRCWQQISYEHSLNQTFVSNPESKLIRDLGKSLHIGSEVDDFTRYFGTVSATLRPGNTNE
jgi:hypothetical protein